MRRMFHLSCTCLCLLFLALLAPSAPAQPLDSAATGSDPAAPQLTQEGRFAAAVAASEGTFHAELARLTGLFRQAGTPEEALALQRRIGALKQNWEIEMMELQLRFAREAGRLEQVQELEAMVAQARAVLPTATADAGR